MIHGGSLIDAFVQQIQEGDADKWFDVAVGVVLDHCQASSVMLDTFSMYLFAQKSSDIKRKVSEIVKSRFYSRIGSTSSDWQMFQRLRWNHVYKRQCLVACNDLINEEIHRLCEEADFTAPLVPSLRKWLTVKMFAFIDGVLFADHGASPSLCTHRSHSSSLKAELETFAVNSFVDVRAKSLFEIILDFPDSLPAVKELRECVRDASNLLSIIAQTLRSILERRLLHLGASTNQILDFYVAMIKVLRIIDASDVLLHFVAAPVRAYLKARPDSIRCIISSLTETKDSDLHDELKIGASLAYGIDEDDEDVVLTAGPLAEWSPPKRMKVLAESELLQHQSRGLDILATLVSIYGSTDLFIAEYRNLLAEKMLDNASYATDAELVNVELMKIRFGEDSLHHCEVILRDVEDSKRTNAAVANRAKERSEPLPVTDMLLVSEHYWPSRDADRQQFDSQKLHPSLQALIDDFGRRYHELKKPRVATPWLTQCTVDLTLDFDDGSSRSFKASLLHANLIEHVGDAGKAGVTASALSIATEVDEEDVRSAMRFWLSKGVVRLAVGASSAIAASSMGEEDEGLSPEPVYTIVEEQATRMAEDSQLAETSFEQEHSSGSSANSSAEARLQAAKEFSETFVRGLLRSHGAMPLDRLQTMLTMMLRAAIENGGMQMQKFTLTSADLAFVQHRPSFMAYLQHLVDHQVLDVDNGMYSERKR